MRDLSTLTNLELQKFFNSFDHVLADVDGVLWNLFDSIPDTQDAVKSLKKLGKKVILVSNNTTKSLDIYHRQLIKNGFDIDKDEVVIPSLAMISFLKKQNFHEEIFMIGMTPLKQALEDAGFKIAARGPDRIEEALDALALNTVVDDGSVGAVIADVDINLNYVNLQKAASFLRRPEVLFLKGAPDLQLPIGRDRAMIGPGFFTKILEDMTKRKGLPMAKPSPYLDDYIVEKFQIKDRSKVLFIGDSILTDMCFAAECGYRKLLVLSGLTRREELGKWKFPQEYKPDYFADSLKTVHECILRCFGSKL